MAIDRVTLESAADILQTRWPAARPRAGLILGSGLGGVVEAFEVRAEIVPVGPGTHFTTLIARMENGERRVLAHNLFSDRDGVPFSARNHKAKAVAVSAKDIDGKPLQVEMGWKK